MAAENDQKYHQVLVIKHTRDALILDIDGKRYTFPWRDLSDTLAAAPKQVRQNLEISPSGYGIHWPELDEDIAIDVLLGISHEPAGRRDFA